MSEPTPDKKTYVKMFREEKEKYIKAKYERKEFLAPLPPSSISPAKGLVDAICRYTG